MRAAAAQLTGTALRSAWERSDRLFRVLAPEAWLAQPIPLRQPFVFYLGHLPAFAWNHLGRGRLGRPPFHPDFDALFERGIDPVGVDSYAPQAQWPAIDAVVAYRDQVRAALSRWLTEPLSLEDETVGAMVLEHELMHHETLLYMLQELRHEWKRRPADWPPLATGSAPPPASRTVDVDAGEVVLGAPRRPGEFRWDNEVPEHGVTVAAFGLDDRPVTNADLLDFVRAGGYAERRLWRDDDWAWVTRNGVRHPHAWQPVEGSFAVRTLFEDVPLEAAESWPASVSWAEAAAYTRWQGARLPTEAEHHHAASGAPKRGNFDFAHGSPRPVRADPSAVSQWGVYDLVGDGWEWTSSPFAPFPGFTPLPRYPGYSADFFDRRHFVLRGASWATDSRLVRSSFRNWFQPHYPYVFAKFRCVR